MRFEKEESVDFSRNNNQHRDSSELKSSNHKKSIIYAFICGIFFAISNALSSIMTAKYGPIGIGNFWFACLLSFPVFHLLNRCIGFEPEASFDIYYDKQPVQTPGSIHELE